MLHYIGLLQNRQYCACGMGELVRKSSASRLRQTIPFRLKKLKVYFRPLFKKISRVFEGPMSDLIWFIVMMSSMDIAKHCALFVLIVGAKQIKVLVKYIVPIACSQVHLKAGNVISIRRSINIIIYDTHNLKSVPLTREQSEFEVPF